MSDVEETPDGLFFTVSLDSYEPGQRFVFPDEAARGHAMVGYLNADGELIWTTVEAGEALPEPPEWAVDWRESGADLLGAFNRSTNAARFNTRWHRCCFCGRRKRRCRCI